MTLSPIYPTNQWETESFWGFAHAVRDGTAEEIKRDHPQLTVFMPELMDYVLFNLLKNSAPAGNA